MARKQIVEQHHKTFDSIRQFDTRSNEFWLARQLAEVLEYSEYRHFLSVIERAKEACRNSGHRVADHFEDILEMVEIGSGAKRQVADIRLSRYACYLIVQNGDPSKPVIANGQTYFAIQTRRQELRDDTAFARLTEDEKRLAIRNELAEHNKYLAATAKEAGVETPLDYAIFQDHGYKGLYGGLGARDIHVRKRLKKSQKILDHGQHRACCQPVSRDADGRKASAGASARQAASQPDPLSGWGQSPSDHEGVGRHHARGPADAADEYQASRESAHECREGINHRA